MPRTDEHLINFWPGIEVVALAENGDNMGFKEPFSPLPGLRNLDQ